MNIYKIKRTLSVCSFIEYIRGPRMSAGGFALEYWMLFACVALVCAVLYPLLRKEPVQLKDQNVPPPGAEARVHGPSLSCTCEEWRTERARFRQGDPRRLCSHLCSYLALDILRLPEALVPFAQTISLMHEEKQGIPHRPPAFAFVLGDSGYISTIESGAYPWATVYIGRNRYSFNVMDGRWAEGGIPPFAVDIGNLIQAETRRRLARQQNSQSNASGEDNTACDDAEETRNAPKNV